MKAINDLKEKIKKWYRELPDKKKHVELLTALLSVPVLITVILINLGNLNQNKNKQPSSPTTPIQIEIKTPSPQISVTSTQNPTFGECKKEVGPVSIESPEENETITNNPVCIEISYKLGEYCAVAWSYKINDGPWSSYTDKDICLYNLPDGDKKLKLNVKSIASIDEKTLERNFVYDGESTSATSSASPIN